MTERKNNKATAAKANTKKAATTKKTVAKQKSAKPEFNFREFASTQAKEREALAQKIETTDRSKCSESDFAAIQRAATQHNYYSFASKVADVLEHATQPDQAKRNNYGKMTALCFMLHGENVENAIRKATHQANTTRSSNGKPYNPQLSNFEKAIRFVLSNFDKKAITAKQVQKEIGNKCETQAREFLKSVAFVGCGVWIGRGGQLETENADIKKVNTLKKAFGIK